MKKLNIIYEDKEIIVVNKESGKLCISTDKIQNNTLYHEVSDYLKKSNPLAKVFIIHRLDKDTSGIIMFAKNEKIKHLYQDNWNDLVKSRIYHAIVHGIPNKEKGRIESYLKENKFLYMYSTNDKLHGLPAITNYEVIKSNKNYSLLKINIETGRKNQIRVHMKDINHPIVGDKKYGFKDKEKRLMLHASTLEITNPISKKIMTFTSEIPNCFTNYIK